jgi:hypothetical protein
MMQQPNDNLVQQFKMINIIYLALGAGMLFSVAMFAFMVESGTVPVNNDLTFALQIAVPVLAVAGFAAGKFMYSMFGKKAKEDSNDANKIMQYRTATIIVWALLEGPGLFAGISYFMTGNKIFLAFFAMIFVGFIISKPSISKFQQDF